MKKGIILPFLFCLANICTAQKEGNVWYFGEHAGLDFNTSTPTPLTGMLSTQEGCSSIADRNTGQLLMYTDGDTVWDRNHNQMPANIANPLRGSFSSTQSALIVPQPGSESKYYIFTTDAFQRGPLCYSIADMALNGGNGDLVSWNNVLMDTTMEKLAAVGNCDRSIYWIVAHARRSDSFYAFRLTSAGISGPVISEVGVTHHHHAGYLKFSPDGHKLGVVGRLALIPQGTVELFDFDFNTGIISNPITDFITYPLPFHPVNDVYGCSFSPDGSKFYVSVFYALTGINPRKVYQYDLSSGNPANIIASKTDIALQGDTAVAVGAIQNGPDGKMYITTIRGTCIDIIHNPNAAGAACNYQPKALYYNSGTYGRLGLPNLPENLMALKKGPEFTPPQQLKLCKGDTAWAPQQPHTYVISPATGVWTSADRSLVGFSPGITTTYTVISSSPCTLNDTTIFTIYVSQEPVAGFVFTPEALQPSDISLTLTNQSIRAQSYQWYNSSGAILSSEKDLVLSHPGLGKFCYTLVATDSIGCSDTMRKCIEVVDHGPVFIPNTFSPNGDGLNDVFRIYGLYLELLEFSVYNRYGERVFYTTQKSQGWDGRYKQKLCDAGTYYYLIRLVDGNGKKVTRKGDINLVF